VTAPSEAVGRRPADRSSSRLVRLASQYAAVILAALVVNFALPRLAPGDPVDYLVPPEAGTVEDAVRESMLERFDLDGSASQQFTSYLGNLAQGDLGISVRDGRPVSEVVTERLWWSLLLVGTAVAVSTILGVALGFAAGWRRGSRRDVSLLAVVLALDALPAFFVGLMLLLVFSVQLEWLPVYGAVSPEALSGWAWIPA